MGIHTQNNLSNWAHQAEEPRVPDHFDYDDYIILEEVGPDPYRSRLMKIKEYQTGYIQGKRAWEVVRTEFLRLYNEDKRRVILIGRVYN